jgi:hypothetical protein
MSISQTVFPDVQVSDYHDMRGKIKNGDILICSGTGFFSAMIQRATDSVWSHVGIILRLDEIERVMLLESVEPIGVRTIRLSKYLNGYDDKQKKPYKGGFVIIRHKEFDNRVDKVALKEMARFAVEKLGHPYDKDEIAKIAARIMSAKIPFTPKQKRKIRRDNEYICSEYAARCYESIGIEVQWNKRGFIAPSDFAADPNFELFGVLQQP